MPHRESESDFDEDEEEEEEEDEPIKEVKREHYGSRRPPEPDGPPPSRREEDRRFSADRFLAIFNRSLVDIDDLGCHRVVFKVVLPISLVYPARSPSPLHMVAPS